MQFFRAEEALQAYFLYLHIGLPSRPGRLHPIHAATDLFTLIVSERLRSHSTIPSYGVTSTEMALVVLRPVLQAPVGTSR